MEENKEIVETQTLVDLVREKVRKVLFENMPQEKLDQYITNEYNSFFKETKGSYGSSVSSPLRDMIYKEIRESMDKKIKEYVNKEVNTYWNNYGESMICDLAKRIAPEVQIAISQNITQRTLEAIRNGM